MHFVQTALPLVGWRNLKRRASKRQLKSPASVCLQGFLPGPDSSRAMNHRRALEAAAQVQLAAVVGVVVAVLAAVAQP
ncbi:MAG: hypothetical protein QHC66_01665, partial [Pusillimonas sp.]|nr:hypothetical protein [Pusillimonas sp.]